MDFNTTARLIDGKTKYQVEITILMKLDQERLNLYINLFGSIIPENEQNGLWIWYQIDQASKVTIESYEHLCI